MSFKKHKRYIPLIIQICLLVFLKPLFHFFLRLKVEGREHIPVHKKGLVIATNHITELDAILVGVISPFASGVLPLFFVAKPTEGYSNFGLRGLLYGGRLFRLLGAYRIYSGRRNYAYSLQHHLEILESGETVVIFPEGRRTLDGELQAARGGVAFMAHNKRVPVLPVGISGLYGITLKEFFLRKRQVTIKIGKPIQPKELFRTKKSFEKPHYKREAQLVMHMIQKLMVE